MNKILIVLLLLIATTASADVYTTPTSTDVYQIPYWVRGSRNWDDYMNNGIKSIDSILSILSDDTGVVPILSDDVAVLIIKTNILSEDTGELITKTNIISDDMVDVRQSSDIISSDILGFSSAISTDSLSVSGKYAFPTTIPTFATPILSYDVATGAIIWHTGVGGVTGAAADLSNLASVAINTALIPDADSTHDSGADTAFWSTTYSDAVTFPATQVTSADVNTLDDYEEGSWTPGISFGGAVVDLTYTAQDGSYTKVGNRVFFNGRIALSNKGSSNGNALVTGLPFTVATGNTGYSATSIIPINVSFADYPCAYAEQATTTITLYEIANAGTGSTLTDANFSNSTTIIISGHYKI